MDAEVQLGVDERFARGRNGGDGGSAICDLKVADGEVGHGALLLGLRSGRGAADAGEVPDAVLILDELDGWRRDGKVGDAHLAVEEERPDFNTNVQGLRLKKGRGAEGRIVGDGDVVGDNAAGEQRKAEMAERDLAAEGAGKLGLQHGAEGVGIDEEWKQSDDDDDQGDDRKKDFYRTRFHDDHLSRNETGWNCSSDDDILQMRQLAGIGDRFADRLRLCW